jgi:thiol-disulfide isomerase/thioredoxin
MKKIISDFLKDPFQKYLSLSLFLLCIVALFISQLPSNSEGDEKLVFYYHPSCPHCADEKPFLDDLEKKYNVKFTRLDVTHAENKEKFLNDVALYNVTEGVPLTILNGKAISGFNTKDTTGILIENNLKAYLQIDLDDNKDQAQTNENLSTQYTPLEKIQTQNSWLNNLENYSLLTLAVILGLLDGFNPCAMWVLIVLISIVAQLNDRKRIWLIVGSFLLASGILYFLFMTAWLNAFLFIGAVRPLMIIIGIIAIGSGILSLRSFFTKADMNCKVGDAEEKSKTVKKMHKIVSAPLSIMTIGSIIVLAFVVNSIEFACSSAIPAVFTQMLAISNLSGLEYYWYIFVYVFFFMLDDLIIFSIAIFAISKVSQDKYLRYSSLVGGLLLIVLGVLLAFFPTLLSSLF